MVRSHTTGRAPGKPTRRLLIPFVPGTTSLFALKAAAARLCEIIWLTDLSDRRVARSERVLARFGAIVDIADLSPGQVIDAVRPVQPDGVLALTDSSIPLLAQVAAAFDLPFHSPLVAERLCDKFGQREALRQAGVWVPSFRAIPPTLDRTAAEAIVAAVGLPAVLKPRRGDGSRRVRLVRGVEDLLELVGLGDTTSVEPAGWMIEGYLPSDRRAVSRFADVVSVESVVVEGTVQHLTVTGRLPFADPFRETGSVLPSDVSPSDADRARGVATSAIVGLGIANGCVHTELKFTQDGPRIVEVNGRIGGGVPELLALAGTGLDLLRFGMERALGLPMALELPLHYSNVAYRRIAAPPVGAGVITAMSGQAQLKELPGVDEVSVNRGPGDAVDWRLGLDDFVFSAFGAAPDHAQVEQMCERIDRTVNIEYEVADAASGEDRSGEDRSGEDSVEDPPGEDLSAEDPPRSVQGSEERGSGEEHGSTEEHGSAEEWNGGWRRSRRPVAARKRG